MLMMLPFEAPTIFEGIHKSYFRMPRVVKNQRDKFENDDLFRQLSHEAAVKYTGAWSRSKEERQMHFIGNCHEGHVDISVVQNGHQFLLMWPPNSNPAFQNEGCDFNKEVGKVHIKAGFILNGVCVTWRGWIEIQTLEGFGCLEFDERRAYKEDNELVQHQQFHHSLPPIPTPMTMPMTMPPPPTSAAMAAAAAAAALMPSAGRNPLHPHLNHLGLAAPPPSLPLSGGGVVSDMPPSSQHSANGQQQPPPPPPPLIPTSQTDAQVSYQNAAALAVFQQALNASQQHQNSQQTHHQHQQQQSQQQQQSSPLHHPIRFAMPTMTSFVASFEGASDLGPRAAQNNLIIDNSTNSKLGARTNGLNPAFASAARGQRILDDAR